MILPIAEKAEILSLQLQLQSSIEANNLIREEFVEKVVLLQRELQGKIEENKLLKRESRELQQSETKTLDVYTPPLKGPFHIVTRK